MFPALDDLLEGFSRYAERRQRAAMCDARAVGAALKEAARLAQGNEPNEPAALFYALSRRPRAFGKLHGDMLVLLAVEQARAVGFELSFVAVELDIHVIRILRGELTFLELRGWFAARLVPIKRRPWPPKKR
jgi:hypothetical protein